MGKQALSTFSDLAELEGSQTALKSGDYVLGLKLARSARQSAYEQNNERLYARACALEAAHLARSGLEAQARELAEQILPTIDRICEPQRSIEVRNIISRCYVNLGEAGNALPFALESLKRSQQLGDDVLLAWSYCRLGATYGSLRYTERCIQSLEKAIEYAEKTSDNEVKFGCYQNLANSLRWQVDFKSQIQPLKSLTALKNRTVAVLKKAIEYSEGQPSREIYAYRTKTGLYAALKDEQNLARVLQKYEIVCRQLNNPLHGLIAKISRAYLMLFEGKGQLAADFIETELIPLQNKVGDVTTSIDLLQLEYQVYKSIGESAKALVALEKIYRDHLGQSVDVMREQSQLLLGEIEIVDAKHEAKTWREQSEKSAIQFEKERQAARHDVLTGLLNRRAFDEDMAAILQQLGSRKKLHRALAIIDVDHFKAVNDQFGHEVGDQVLHRIGQGLQESIRGLDTVYRYGGEEFIVVLNLENSADLMEFCERTRKFIAQMNWADQLGSHTPLTVSIGATLINADDSAKSIVIRADQAMYQAKHDGRNLTRLVFTN